MNSPRELINESAGLAFGEQRAALLDRALAALPGDEDPEARAVALAMLAQQAPERLPQAIEEGKRVLSVVERPDWILMHLADAAVLAGQDEEALRFASRVDEGFFLSGDLRWRVSRLAEIRAVALLRLGREAEALSTVDALLADLVRHGDEDDLPPPGHLVRTALSLVEGDRADLARAVLRRMAEALNLAVWFPPSVVEEIQAVVPV
ncbi:hypothetical protein [Actinophytocola xanthii]|uniref:MalT-like TPR region domain-containing protein n=1 Tax=Actinophytocola xanthii TaxID=1912961 RepID=A0A1Q8CL69_9PSEU|nr:hypothetical protein [Actinophytocola xanthii]OLF15097.1 hypothetical protein BU204_23820 [Actinophytocola xanthii]